MICYFIRYRYVLISHFDISTTSWNNTDSCGSIGEIVNKLLPYWWKPPINSQFLTYQLSIFLPLSVEFLIRRCRFGMTKVENCGVWILRFFAGSTIVFYSLSHSPRWAFKNECLSISFTFSRNSRSIRPNARSLIRLKISRVFFGPLI